MNVQPEIPTLVTTVTWETARPDEAGNSSVEVELCAPDSLRPVVEIPGDSHLPWRVQLDPRNAAVSIGDGVPDPYRPWRAAGADMIRAARQYASGPAKNGVTVRIPAETSDAEIEAFTVGIVAGSHEMRVSGTAPNRVPHVTLSGSRDARNAVCRGAALGRATALARDLANLPSNLKTPATLAGFALSAVGAKAGVEVTVFDENWLAETGFGGVLAVGGGSAAPPRLIEVRWHPPQDSREPSSGGADVPHVVLVGKGITFDTGGISVKPAENMHLMKTDMAGGAAVLGAMCAIADLGLNARVTALVPCAENMLSGSAYRPGDVVTHYGGLTTEVTNTDAEGRMVLADALAYAAANLEPDVLVDIATLTGAMKVALGMRTGAVFTDDQELATALCRSGSDVGERWWRLPLSPEYADAVRSAIADLKQAPGGPGAITAALFLKEFAGSTRWAHLDIAGPARAEDTYDEVNPVASGFGARTLTRLVEQIAARGPAQPERPHDGQQG